MRNLLTAADPDRSSRFAAVAVAIVAGLICIWLLVRLIWLMVPRGSDEAAPAGVMSDVGQGKSAATSIAQWHLFGNAQSVDLAARALNAPKTSLKLNLRGTLALPDAKDGLAMIADEQNIERSYKVGDAIGGAKLAEVYTDHVVLIHDGVNESLNMPRPEEHLSATPAERGNLVRGTGVASSVPPGYAPGKPASTPAAGAAAGPALARMSPADIAREVQFEPVFDGGKIAGARLSGSGAVGALMSQVGLRPSDVVTAVNGTPLSNVSNPQALLDKFGNASSLQITVQRDGKPATLTLNLR